MMERYKYHDILYNDQQLGPYPDHLLKRVDKPTTEIPGPIARVSEGDHVFAHMAMGEFGEEYAAAWDNTVTPIYPLGRAITDLQYYVNKYAGQRFEVAPEKAPLPGDARAVSRHIKALGYFLGADLVGIGRLSQSAVYSESAMGKPVEADYKYAIVLMCRKHEPTSAATNGWDDIVDVLSFQVYQKCLMQSEVMSNYLRLLGHEAEPSNMWNYSTLMPQVILDAGLGEISRLGIILNPFFGANFKASAVLTNLELETDGYVDFGLQDFCKKCTICADQCPAGAVAHGPKTLHNGYYTWKLDTEKCGKFDVMNKEGSVCGRCTEICPWHRPDMGPSEYKGWDGDLEWLHQTVRDQRDQVMKEDYVDPRERTNKWWFRHLIEDGKVVVATGKNPETLCREYPLQEGPVDKG
jgi:epoxyqueuosine reductase